MTDQFAYMPYGYAKHTGTTDTPFQWLGGYGVYYDADTQLHLTLYRAYSCHLKRFMQADPLGIDGGSNVYMMANLNPLWFIDPYGLCPESEFFGPRAGIQSTVVQNGTVGAYAQVAGTLPGQETQWSQEGAIIAEAYVVGARGFSQNSLGNGDLGSQAEVAVMSGQYGGLLGVKNANAGSTINGNYLTGVAGGGLHGIGVKAKAHAAVVEVGVHPQGSFPIPWTVKRLTLTGTLGVQAIAIGGDIKLSLTRGVRIKASALFGLDLGVEWKVSNRQ